MPGPTSTVSAPGWSAVGAATVHEAVNEAVESDAEYAVSDWPPERVEFGIASLGAGTQPVSARFSPRVNATWIARLTDAGSNVWSSTSGTASQGDNATRTLSVTSAGSATRLIIDIWPTDGVLQPDVARPGVFE